jgi:hypothetical protein
MPADKCLPVPQLCTPIDADTSHILKLPISATDKKQILGGNAARIFGL